MQHLYNQGQLNQGKLIDAKHVTVQPTKGISAKSR